VAIMIAPTSITTVKGEIRCSWSVMLGPPASIKQLWDLDIHFRMGLARRRMTAKE